MSNPLLAKIKLPGKVFQLPSRGVFYEKGVLADYVTDGEIQVYALSALAEMKLRSADLLFTGKVIREIVLECVPEVIKPEALLVKDIDAIFTFLRIASYGPSMTMSLTHECKDPLKRKEHKYGMQIDTILTQPNNEQLKHKDLLYKCNLSNGQIVHMKPTKYLDSLAVMHMQLEMTRQEVQGRKPSDDDIEKTTIADLMHVIEGVQPESESVVVRDVEQIEQWLRAINRKLMEEMLTSLKESDDWGFKYVLNLKCKDCGEDFEHHLDLNPVNFFFG